MLYLFLFLTLGAYGAYSEKHQYMHLVDPAQDFFNNPQGALDRQGGYLVCTAQPIKSLCEEVERMARGFMRSNKRAWQGEHAQDSLPFWANITALSTLFDQQVAGAQIDSLFKYIDKAVCLLSACDCMSYALDPDKDNMDLQARTSLCTLCRNMHTEHSATTLYFDFSAREGVRLSKKAGDSNIVVKYIIKEQGSSSPLDFIAALNQDMMLVSVPKIQQGMHRLYCARGALKSVGAGALLNNHFGCIRRALTSFDQINTLFPQLSSKKVRNHRALISEACALLCSPRSDQERAKLVTWVFTNFHESRLYHYDRPTDMTDRERSRRCDKDFCKPAYPQMLRCYEGFYERMVLPLCSPSEIQCLQKNGDKPEHSKKTEQEWIFDKWHNEILGEMRQKRQEEGKGSFILTFWQ